MVPNGRHLSLRDRSLKAARDFAVVSVHWGFGSGDALADYQWPLAKALMSTDGYVVLLDAADNGAVVVELVPTVLVTERLPRLAFNHTRILERLTRLSAPHGTRITDRGQHSGVAAA